MYINQYSQSSSVILPFFMAINLNQLDLSAPDSHTSQYTEFIGGNS